MLVLAKAFEAFFGKEELFLKQQSPSKVKFVLTGFGEFHGVKDNPTKRLIESLTQEELQRCCAISAKVLEVSIQGVDRYVKAIKSNIKGQMDDQTKVVFVHFGVDDGSKNFVLECPDMRNNTPLEEQICKGYDLDHGLGSNLNLQEVLTHILKESKSVTEKEDIFKLGENPGRYICNYIYFQSLNELQKLPNCDQLSSLFVHCPPFKEVSQEDQKKLFFILMKALLNSVQNNTQ